MKIEQIIVHQILSETGSNDVEVVLRNDVFDNTDDNVIRLMELVGQSYASSKSLDYGRFKSSLNFPQNLNSYIEGDREFCQMTEFAMDELKSHMESQILATGGYMLFARYKTEKTDFFISVMLKIKDELVFDSKMNLLQVERLNLDQLHFAARVNLSLLSIDSPQRYVSFLKGKKAADDVSGYFKAFLGIDNESFESSSNSTAKLVSTIKKYAAENKWTDEQAAQAKTKIYDYAIAQFELNKTVELEAIGNLVVPEDSDSFVEFANDCELPGSFHVDKNKLKKLRRYSGSDRHVSISFSNDALESKRITIDQKSDTLTVIGIPLSLKNMLMDS